MSTPHNNANLGDISKTVIMPGDPLRAKMIAEKFLENPILFNEVRNIYGYTGKYKGKDVSVMASGMGMPSMGIYSYELYKTYDVENIIRVGTCGGYADKVKLRDVIIAMGVSFSSSYDKQYDLKGHFSPLADFSLLEIAVKKSREMKLNVNVGNVLTTDVFYEENHKVEEAWRDMGVLGVEMETAALYMNAAHLHKKALAIFTVSDHLFTGEALSSDDRQNSFLDMIKVALETAICI